MRLAGITSRNTNVGESEDDDDIRVVPYVGVCKVVARANEPARARSLARAYILLETWTACVRTHTRAPFV